MKKTGFLLVFICLFQLLPAQSRLDTAGFPYAGKYILDLKTLELMPEDAYWTVANKRNVPFDVPFILQLRNVNPGAHYDSIRVCIRHSITYNDLWDTVQRGTKVCPNISLWRSNSLMDSPDIVITIPPLKANSNYSLSIEGRGKPSIQEVNIFADSAIKILSRSLLQESINLDNCRIGIDSCIRQYIINDDLYNLESIFLLIDARIIDIKDTSRILNNKDFDAYITKVIPIVTRIYRTTQHLLDNPDYQNKDLVDLVYGNKSVHNKLKVLYNDSTIGIPSIYHGTQSETRLISYRGKGNSNLILDPVYLENLKENYLFNIAKFYSMTGDTAFYKTENKWLIDASLLFFKGTIDSIESLKRSIELLQGTLEGEKVKIVKQIIDNVSIPINTFATFRARAKWYFCPDVGIATVFSGFGNSIIPYYGLNLSLLPVNRDMHFTLFNALSKKTHTPECKSGYRFIQSLSFIAGITAMNPQNAINEKFTGVIGDFGLLTGVGLRLTNYIRVCGGAMWLNRNHSNPLIESKQIVGRPFVSLSLDLDMIGYIERLRENAALQNVLKKE